MSRPLRKRRTRGIKSLSILGALLRIDFHAVKFTCLVALPTICVCLTGELCFNLKYSFITTSQCRSDIDVAIELPGVDHSMDKKNCLFQLSGALKASGATNDVFVNHFAKVPVATFVTVPNFGASFMVIFAIH